MSIEIEIVDDRMALQIGGILRKHGIDTPYCGIYGLSTRANVESFKEGFIFKRVYQRWEEPFGIDLKVVDGLLKNVDINVHGKTWMEVAEEVAKEIIEDFPKVKVKITLVSKKRRFDDNVPWTGTDY